MRKVLVIVLMLVLGAISVNAGSISGLDYEDCTAQGFLWWSGTCVSSIGGEINDDDVEIDADTLDGNTAETFITHANTLFDKVHSFSYSRMVKFLYGEFLTFLDSRYIHRLQQCEAYNYDNQQRIFDLQQRVYDLEVAS